MLHCQFCEDRRGRKAEHRNAVMSGFGDTPGITFLSLSEPFKEGGCHPPRRVLRSIL
jgi:hypothetical protein